MGMINLGSGLSAAGASVASTAGEMALSQQKSNLENQRLQLADQLAGARAWNAPGVSQQVELANIGVQQKKSAVAAFTKLMGGAGTSDTSTQIAPQSSDATGSPQATDTGVGTPSPQSQQQSNDQQQTAPPLPQGFDAIPPNVKTQMANAAALGGGPEAGLKVYTEWVTEQNKIFDQRKGNRLITGAGDIVGQANIKQITPFTDEDRKKFGLSPDDQGGLDEDGKPFVLGDTSAKIKLRQGPEYARINKEGERLQQDNFTAPTMIGYTGPDGEEVQKAAIYDKKKGQYFDVETLQPIQSPKNLRVIGTSTTSARSQAAISRILTNAEDATSGIENLSNISSGASGGLYKNLETTPLSALSRTVTPQEVQDVQATIAGLSRAMGGLATGGLAVDENVMKSYEGLNQNTGDSYITKMRKLAEMRQQSTNALDVQSVSPILSNDQRKKAAALSERIKVAIPWTVTDVQKLENSDNPKASLRDVSMQKLGVTSDVHIGQAPTDVDPVLWQHMTRQEQALWQK